MNSNSIHQFLMTQLTAEQASNIASGWVNEVPTHELAESLSLPVELIRGLYFAKDLGFFEEEGVWFSHPEGKVNG